ncbi:MAG: secondary thiamine-phosphate synthase enzyme YjbQ [Candidatus Cloacimonetes bacterium]|nr:secondary thiamine-phosphate synthase enzyme YjbQ [Candidatus Cloacimonadota bacterium]
MKQQTFSLNTRGKGLYEFTHEIDTFLRESSVDMGLINIFIKHTSASLTIQENADPSAKADMLEFLERLVPEHQSWHTHTAEGPDDTTSHLKSCLTQTSLSIPISNGRLNIGTWQGIYLWEHRNHSHTRKIVFTILS